MIFRKVRGNQGNEVVGIDQQAFDLVGCQVSVGNHDNLITKEGPGVRRRVEQSFHCSRVEEIVDASGILASHKPSFVEFFALKLDLVVTQLFADFEKKILGLHREARKKAMHRP